MLRERRYGPGTVIQDIWYHHLPRPWHQGPGTTGPIDCVHVYETVPGQPHWRQITPAVVPTVPEWWRWPSPVLQDRLVTAPVGEWVALHQVSSRSDVQVKSPPIAPAAAAPEPPEVLECLVTIPEAAATVIDTTPVRARRGESPPGSDVDWCWVCDEV